MFVSLGSAEVSCDAEQDTLSCMNAFGVHFLLPER